LFQASLEASALNVPSQYVVCAGVRPFGAITMRQLSATTGMPSSVSVGTDAYAPPRRFGAAIASARAVPFRKGPAVAEAEFTKRPTCPPSRAATAGPVPGNTTTFNCRESMPAALARRPSAMWFAPATALETAAGTDPGSFFSAATRSAMLLIGESARTE
jgi:hypothetical protein